MKDEWALIRSYFPYLIYSIEREQNSIGNEARDRTWPEVNIDLSSKLLSSDVWSNIES